MKVNSDKQQADAALMRRILEILDDGSRVAAGNVISCAPEDYDEACVDLIRAAVQASAEGGGA